jgi:hypothetical protein
MTEDEAQQIVYAFADVLSEHSEYILDARLLQHPKAMVYTAFAKHIAHYEKLYSMDAALFRRKGYDVTLEQLRALRLRVGDFQEIDPEDLAPVAEINARPDWLRLHEQLAQGAIPADQRSHVEVYLRRADELTAKYTHRSGTERPPGWPR